MRPVGLVAIRTRTIFVRLIATPMRLLRLVVIRTTTSLLALATLGMMIGAVRLVVIGLRCSYR